MELKIENTNILLHQNSSFSFFHEIVFPSKTIQPTNNHQF
jgi:hypothetical protein